MRETLKRLAKMTMGYGVVQWAGPAISFIFTPILTRILTPNDYGVAEYVLTVISAINILSLLALPQALTTHYNDRPDDIQWQRSVIGSALTLVILIGIPIGGLLFFFAQPLAEFGLQEQRYGFFFKLVGVTIVFGLCTNILVASAQAALKARLGMLFSLTTIIMTVVGNVLFIIILRWGVVGMLLVPITTGLVLSGVTAFLTYDLVGRPLLPIMKLLLQSGALLLPSMIAVWMLQLSDRMILVHYVSTEALGFYTIANKIASLLAVIMGPVYVIWTPLMLATQHEPGAKQKYANLSRYLIAFVLIASLGLGLFATEILIILTRPAYLPAAPYVGFLSYVYVLGTVGTILGTDAMAGKQLKELSGSVLAGAIVNLILNFILIPFYGIWGATIATVIGYAIPQIILYLFLRKQSLIPYQTSKLLIALLIQICLLLVGLFIPNLALILRLGIKILMFFSLFVIFLWLGIITRYELEQFLALVRYRLSFAYKEMINLGRAKS